MSREIGAWVKSRIRVTCCFSAVWCFIIGRLCRFSKAAGKFAGKSLQDKNVAARCPRIALDSGQKIKKIKKHVSKSFGSQSHKKTHARNTLGSSDVEKLHAPGCGQKNICKLQSQEPGELVTNCDAQRCSEQVLCVATNSRGNQIPARTVEAQDAQGPQWIPHVYAASDMLRCPNPTPEESLAAGLRFQSANIAVK